MSTQPHYRLRVARQRAGLTQRDLVYLFGETSNTVITKLEHGARKVDLGFAIRYHVLLEAPMDWLFETEYRQYQILLTHRARRLRIHLLDREYSRTQAQRIAYLEQFLAAQDQNV